MYPTWQCCVPLVVCTQSGRRSASDLICSASCTQECITEEAERPAGQGQLPSTDQRRASDGIDPGQPGPLQRLQGLASSRCSLLHTGPAVGHISRLLAHQLTQSCPLVVRRHQGRAEAQIGAQGGRVPGRRSAGAGGRAAAGAGGAQGAEAAAHRDGPHGGRAGGPLLLAARRRAPEPGGPRAPEGGGPPCMPAPLALAEPSCSYSHCSFILYACMPATCMHVARCMHDSRHVSHAEHAGASAHACGG